jgi:hypothetical protein
LFDVKGIVLSLCTGSAKVLGCFDEKHRISEETPEYISYTLSLELRAIIIEFGQRLLHNSQLDCILSVI